MIDIILLKEYKILRWETIIMNWLGYFFKGLKQKIINTKVLSLIF